MTEEHWSWIYSITSIREFANSDCCLKQLKFPFKQLRYCLSMCLTVIKRDSKSNELTISFNPDKLTISCDMIRLNLSLSFTLSTLFAAINSTPSSQRVGYSEVFKYIELSIDYFWPLNIKTNCFHPTASDSRFSTFQSNQ